MEFADVCGRKWVAQNPTLVTNPTVTLHYGNQGSAEDLAGIRKQMGGQAFDFVIDDGSHLNEHMRFTLLELFPHMALGVLWKLGG